MDDIERSLEDSVWLIEHSDLDDRIEAVPSILSHISKLTEVLLDLHEIKPKGGE